MKLGIDARRLTHRRLDGRFTYLKNALANILQLDNENEYILYVDGRIELDSPFNKDNVTFEIMPRQFGRIDTVLNDWLRFRKVTNKNNVSGVHLPVDPYAKLDVPYLITGHDLTIYKRHYRCDLPLSEYFKIEAFRKYSKLTFGEAARNARRIHCITHYMKDEFKRYLNIPDDRLKVIYPGGDNPYFKAIDDIDALTEFKRRLGISGEYIMAFGNKNLCVLLEAYGRLSKKLQDHFSLVITGPTFQSHKELNDLTSHFGISEYVVFVNRMISHAELSWFYNAASLFALPSQYEMFCNMLLEAMQCKCPILASGLIPNREVGGNSIRYYDNINDTRELSEAISNLLCSEDSRQQLSETGHVRGGNFTWEEHARKMLGLYREAFV